MRVDSSFKGMEILLVFKILACCGCWRPISWSSSYKAFVYNIYSVSLIFALLSSLVFTIIDASQSPDTDAFVQQSYILITELVGVCKLINVLIRREGVIRLIDFAQKEICDTWHTEETQIRSRYDKQFRSSTRRYMAIVAVSVVSNILNSLMVDYPNHRLSLGNWAPYNYSSTIAFRLTYLHQVVSMVTLAQVHVAVDVLFYGLLIQTCCLFDILEHRLNGIGSNDDDAMKKCVRYHNFIFELATMVNSTLKISIFAQFFGNFLVLCVSLAQLLKYDIFSSDFLATIIYLSAITVQNFLYCWFGNEVKLKSIALADAIFQSDWTRMNVKLRKMLLIVMYRTKSPIAYEAAHVITVNVDFFVVLVKNSYSMYNVLQNTQK